VENHQKKCCGKELPEKIENCQKKAARNFCRKKREKISAENVCKKFCEKRLPKKRRVFSIMSSA